MIGVLYRYPHPYNLGKFIYVGQGAKRDKKHRSGNSSFGRRFIRNFPGIKLPEPIRENIEVENHLELNESETIWIFKYHTWYAYPDGMNLVIPGGQDYKTIGRIAGRLNGPKTGRLAVENGRLKSYRTPEHQKMAGFRSLEKKAGIHAPEMYGVGGKIGGKIGGRTTASIPGHMSRAGKISGRRNAESGWIQKLGKKNIELGLLDQARHKRWHLDRNKSNPRCILCSEQNLIVAYA